jgi:adenine-specific DNA methylase
MLLALLLPDPCDPLCPKEFKERARKLLPKVQGNPGPEDIDLRNALLRFIGDFSNWDLSSNQAYLEVGRGLVKAAHPEETPLVVDPFAGGGSIPLEALRLSCEASASDLNPVACLILKVMLEDIPRHALELADELRRVGKEIKEQADKELAEFYPKDPDGATPIAYLWARTVKCEAPNCGAEIPLMRSFWLSKKTNRKRALKHQVLRPRGQPPRVDFEVFEPKAEKEVANGTIARARATCLCCGAVASPERVRAQLVAQRGGADVIFDAKGRRAGGALLLAVVMLKPSETGRRYRLPTERDYEAVRKAQRRVAKIITDWERRGKQGLCPVPDEPLPYRHGHRSIQSPRVYGMASWRDYYTARQNLSLSYLCKSVSNNDENKGMRAVADMSALLLSKFAELATANCRWEPVAECPRSLFTRHDLPAMWDFAEGVPTSSSSGGFGQTLQNVLGTLSGIGSNWRLGQVQQADARNSILPSDSASVWFTDPPYYDAVAYADLSDFFFVWLKRALPGHPLLKDPFDPKNPLAPKLQELTVTTVAGENCIPKSNSDFEKGVADSFAQGVCVLAEQGIGCVVFAHKTTEGWEALLTGMMTAGWVIVASWPVATEMRHRFNAREVAALATSVHLVCRPRPEDAPAGDWADVLRELPNRVGDWMERLQNEGVRGADLVFACIGPALEIFSQYARVETADGKEVKLAQYLEKVWEVVGRTALEQVLGTPEAQARNSTAGALEEDARLTALFLWTLQSTNGGSSKEVKSETSDDEEEADEEETPKKRKAGYSLIFDVVRRFAQPLGIHLPEWEGRIIETEKGVVRLLSVRERSTQLFGEERGQAFAEQLEKAPAGQVQISLFPRSEKSSAPQIKGRGRKKARRGGDVTDESLKTRHEATTLDRVHAAMLLQSFGRTNALRALLQAEQDRGSDFLRLANALSALYPRQSEEKRLLDAMLLAVPR